MKGDYIFSDATNQLTSDEKRNATFLAEEFKYLYFNYGFSDKKVVRKLGLNELNTLIPYLELMGEYAIGEIAEKYQRLNFIALIKNHLYPSMGEHNKAKFIPTDADILHELNEMAAEKARTNLNYYT